MVTARWYARRSCRRAEEEEGAVERLDRWLCGAHVFPSVSAARRACKAGSIRAARAASVGCTPQGPVGRVDAWVVSDGQPPAKPSRSVYPGDAFELRLSGCKDDHTAATADRFKLIQVYRLHLTVEPDWKQARTQLGAQCCHRPLEEQCEQIALFGRWSDERLQLLASLQRGSASSKPQRDPRVSQDRLR